MRTGLHKSPPRCWPGKLAGEDSEGGPDQATPHPKWVAARGSAEQSGGRQLGEERCGACPCPSCQWGDGQHVGGSAGKVALRRER